MNSELTNNKQSNYNNVNSQLSWIIALLGQVAYFTSVVIRNDNKGDSPLFWIIASLGQVAHFTSVVIRNVLATSGWVRSAHTAPYAKSAHNSQLTKFAFTLAETLVVMVLLVWLQRLLFQI